jgi:biotin synthase
MERIRRLREAQTLGREDMRILLQTMNPEEEEYLYLQAREVCALHYRKDVYLRGLIEFSSYCKNDCYYCGLRHSNAKAKRYRLSEEQILDCAGRGYDLGFRTIVLQSGEDPWWTDERMTDLIAAIRASYPDCAITLSIGERSRESYQAMYDAGANRYLLRHETADAAHYGRLHPAEMSFAHRIDCLWTLREIGYQVGCGMMVGTPHQTPETLAKDMELLTAFRPAMAGIGPFLPHGCTPFRDCAAGSVPLSLLCLSLTRILLPDVLLPSTTALGTASSDGRLQGILAGCNVVMPNLSPQNVRRSYMLYDNKAGTELSAAEGLALLKNQVESVGREIVVGRGDHKAFRKDQCND